MKNPKSLKLNTILNLLKSVFSIVFPLITFPYVSRILQPENIGKVNFAGTYVNYFTLIASLGIGTYAIRECSAVRNSRHNLSVVASEIFSINVCTTLVAYLLLVISLVVFRSLDNYKGLIIVQSTVILFATLGTDWINSSMEDFKYITVRTFFFQVISLVLIFAFVRTEEDYLKYAAISVLSTSGANFVNIFYRKKYCDIKFVFNMHVRKHLKPILLLFVMILAQTIFNSADITMLGLFCGDAEVGYYATAYRIKSIIVQVVSSLAVVLMPRMSYYFAENDWNQINEMLRKVLTVMVTIGFPCIAGCVALSSDVVEIVGGSEYANATIPLIILMLSFIVDIFGGIFLGNMICLPTKQEKVFMEACCVAAVVNVILNYWLIPIGGANAAAITSGIAALVIMIWLLIKKDKRVDLSYVNDVLKAPLLGSVIIIIYCYLIGLLELNFWFSLLIRISGSILLYGASQLIVNNFIIWEIVNVVINKFRRNGDVG